MVHHLVFRPKPSKTFTFHGGKGGSWYTTGGLEKKIIRVGKPWVCPRKDHLKKNIGLHKVNSFSEESFTHPKLGTIILRVG